MDEAVPQSEPAAGSTTAVEDRGWWPFWLLAFMLFPYGPFIYLALLRAIGVISALVYLSVSVIIHVGILSVLTKTNAELWQGWLVLLLAGGMYSLGMLQYLVGSKRQVWSRAGRWVWRGAGWVFGIFLLIGLLGNIQAFHGGYNRAIQDERFPSAPAPIESAETDDNRSASAARTRMEPPATAPAPLVVTPPAYRLTIDGRTYELRESAPLSIELPGDARKARVLLKAEPIQSYATDHLAFDCHRSFWLAHDSLAAKQRTLTLRGAAGVMIVTDQGPAPDADPRALAEGAVAEWQTTFREKLQVRELQIGKAEPVKLGGSEGLKVRMSYLHADARQMADLYLLAGNGRAFSVVTMYDARLADQARETMSLTLESISGKARGGTQENADAPVAEALNLQQRAQAFLNRPIPEDLQYVPDSISERLIREHAMNGEVVLDPEMAELLQICATDAHVASKEGSGARRAYFRESAAILEGILDQSSVARQHRRPSPSPPP